MKYVVCFLLTILAVMYITIPILADESDEYRDKVYSEFKNIEIPSEANKIGIDINDPESITQIDSNTIFNYIFSIIKSSISAPAGILVAVCALSLISQIITSLSNNTHNYDTVITIACFVCICGPVISSFISAISVMSSIQTFMVSYVPIYASICVASGNISGALSYNAILLYTCEAVTIFATFILKPILICATVLSVTQSINTEIPDFVSSLRRAFLTLFGLLLTIFSGVIGLQATAGRAADSLSLRAGKYLVSSFVPILGYTITESYRTIQASLGSIRSTIGVFGIVIIALILSIPLISLTVYRCFFAFSEWIASLCQSKSIASLMKGLNNVYSLLSTVLLLYFLMLIISTGMLISLGGNA